jgi:hypothetical protein
VLSHKSSVVSIKNKLNHWIILCPEHIVTIDLVIYKIILKKHALPKDTLDQVEIN